MLELKNISFNVSDDLGEKEILTDVSLTLEDGKFLVVTGPNGGGKSTLAKIIMGIQKPTGGQILWNGIDITNMSITERAKLGIGYAFQHPPRFKGLSVRGLLSLAHGEDLPEDQCCAYLTNVGLCSKDYLNREVDASLSGGEIKRIEIATLMARDLELAKETGCKYHVCHISTKESVELIRKAKAEGVDVTCETAPHYLVFNDMDLSTFKDLFLRFPYL